MTAINSTHYSEKSGKCQQAALTQEAHLLAGTSTGQLNPSPPSLVHTVPYVQVNTLFEAPRSPIVPRWSLVFLSLTLYYCSYSFAFALRMPRHNLTTRVEIFDMLVVSGVVH